MNFAGDPRLSSHRHRHVCNCSDYLWFFFHFLSWIGLSWQRISFSSIRSFRPSSPLSHTHVFLLLSDQAPQIPASQLATWLRGFAACTPHCRQLLIIRIIRMPINLFTRAPLFRSMEKQTLLCHSNKRDPMWRACSSDALRLSGCRAIHSFSWNHVWQTVFIKLRLISLQWWKEKLRQFQVACLLTGLEAAETGEWKRDYQDCDPMPHCTFQLLLSQIQSSADLIS